MSLPVRTATLALVSLSLMIGLGGAEEPEFQIVGTVERQTLSLSILPRPGFRLGADTPVLVRLQGTGVELPRTLFRRADAVDPRAEAPRFEVPFRSTARSPESAPVARTSAAMSSTVGRPSASIRRCGGTRRSRSAHNCR